MIFRVLFFLFLSLSATVARASSIETRWQRLLYWGNAHGSNFYVDPQAKNALEEREALLQGLQKGLPLHCLYPARTMALQQEGALKTAPDLLLCTEYNDFKNRLNAHTVSLVFSSYYVSAPASAFGHTFLKISKEKSGESGHELLDYGVNYAATVGDAGALAFALKGLFGFFKGEHTVVPYYYKVREYNDFESRDLWSYDLDLTQEQIDFLVAHLWELKRAEFNYYYINGNCSMQILRIIQQAYPDRDFLSQLPPWVVPVDTVRVLKPVIKKTHYRPSLQKKAETALFKMSSSERALTVLAVESTELAQPEIDRLDQKAQVRIWDAAIDLYDYQNPRDLLRKDLSFTPQKQKILVARSHVHTITPVQLNERPADPAFSHGSQRWSLGITTRGFQLGWRLTLHDLLDSTAGAPDQAQMEFANLTVTSHRDFSAPRLEELKYFSAINLPVWGILDHRTSWAVGLSTLRVNGSILSHSFRYAGGLTLNFIPKSTLSVLLATETAYDLETYQRASHTVLNASPLLLWRTSMPHLILLTSLMPRPFQLSGLRDSDRWVWRFEARTSFSNRFSAGFTYDRTRHEPNWSMMTYYYL